MKKNFDKQEIELLKEHLAGVRASVLSDKDLADLEKGKLTVPTQLAIANRLLREAISRKNEERREIKKGLHTIAARLDVKILERALLDAGVLTTDNIDKAKADLIKEMELISVKPS